MPQYLWKCTECEVLVEVQHKMAESNVPPKPEDEVHCFCDEPKWKKLITMPAVVGKASYLDGQRKFVDAREAAKLKKEARHSKDPKKKSEIRKEVNKMGIKQYD